MNEQARIEAERIRAAALSYLDRGWVPIPIRRDEAKRPALKWKAFQTQRPSEKQVAYWFSVVNMNVGVVTGEISNIFALDIDGEEGFETIASMGGLPVTVRSRSRQFREIVVFKWPGWKVSNAVKFLPGLDLRGDGGYIQVAPSLHHSGSRYEWLHSPDDTPIAHAPDWLLEHTSKEVIEAKQIVFDRPAVDGEKKYAWTALQRECEKLAQTADGAKHFQLVKSAFALGGFVPGGYLDAGDIEQNLFNVVAPRARDKRAAMETIRKCVRSGAAAPRIVPQR